MNAIISPFGIRRWNVAALVDEKVGKLGQVLCIKFVDFEVAIATGSALDDRTVPVGRWVFAACANHALLLNWRSGQVIHFRTALLDGRVSSSACFSTSVGMAVFGGSDGVIRTVDWRKGTVRSRLRVRV